MPPWNWHNTFIGSEEVGRKIVLAAAGQLSPVTHKLSDQDPAIVLPSTDIKQYESVRMRGLLYADSLVATAILLTQNRVPKTLAGTASVLGTRSSIDSAGHSRNPRMALCRQTTAARWSTSNRFDDLERVPGAAENHGRGWQALEAPVTRAYYSRRL